MVTNIMAEDRLDIIRYKECVWDFKVDLPFTVLVLSKTQS